MKGRKEGEIIFQWEITVQDFKTMIAESDRGIKDVDKWWLAHGEKVKQEFLKGMTVALKHFEEGEIMNDAVDEFCDRLEE